MKLWYDDKKIPLWVEVLAVVILGVVFAVMIFLSM